jgi:hypothetical protein
MRTILLGLALGVGVSHAAAAQRPPVPSGYRWEVGLLLGTTSFSGATDATGPNGEKLTYLPYRPAITGLRVSYGGGGLRLDASVAFGRPGLAFRGAQESGGAGPGAGLLVVGESVYHLWTFGARASTALLRLDGAASLRPSLGLVLERWSAPASPPRLIAGGEAGLGLEVPLKGPLVAEFTGALGYTPRSPFRREDVPQEFRLTSTWRKSVMVTASWRF